MALFLRSAKADPKIHTELQEALTSQNNRERKKKTDMRMDK